MQRRPLDESNVRKAFGRVVNKAELHHRRIHDMRHTFASLLLQAGAQLTYVSAQLGHHDASITMRVYAHWLPDASGRRDVDLLHKRPSVANGQSPRNSPSRVISVLRGRKW